MKKVLLTFLFCVIALSSVSEAATRTTRDLVFEEDESTTVTADESATETLAIKSTIVLTRDGKSSTVVPSHEFTTGDAIKIVFTPNTDGFVYWVTKGSSGNYAVLFPSKQAGEDNSVKRNQEYTIPVKGTFKFQGKAGKEELLCVLSKEKLADLEKIIAASASLEHMTSSLQASAENPKTDSNTRTTRDLVFDDEDSGDVNTKSQTAKKGTPMVTHFTLTHK